MLLVFCLLALLISFYLLAVVCDRYFVDSLDKIAQKLRMNSDMAGATFMAVGSSAPELFIAFIALFKPGNESIGAGTIVGSALFNILVIIGASALVRKALIAWQPVIRDLLFYSASIIWLLISFRDGQVTLNEAFIFVAIYLVYVLAVLMWRKILPYKDDVKDEVELVKKEKVSSKNIGTIMKGYIDNTLDYIFPKAEKYWQVFFVSIIMIAALAFVLVESAVIMAEILNIPAVIIGLTVLAAGTSMPDLISSVIVAKQGRGGMAISNAVGSNIFDILIGLGLPWLVMIALFGNDIPVATENLNSSIILLFATVVAILFLLIMRKWRISRYLGLFLIALYIAYVVWAVL